MGRITSAVLAAGAVISWGAPACWACSIPVFRYALERWPAEPYEAIVYHKGPLGAAEQAALEALRKAGSGEGGAANVEVRTVDLAAPDVKQGEGLPKGEEAAELPWLVVRYPSSLGVEGNAWSGRLTAENVKALLDSPARRELAKGLAGGDCAVWLLIGCGDKAKDDAAAKLLREQLKKLESTIELPRPMDFGGFGEEPPEKDGDAKEHEKLKVAFSLVRASPAEAKEKAFVGTILALDAEFRAEGKPLAIAVFGQGRALPPLMGDGINEENIADVCGFVCGPCSCQVKAMNPGWDLLMTADWSGALEGRLVKQPEAPELTGSVASAPPRGEAPGTPAPKPGEARSGAPLLRNLLLAVAAGIIILAIGSFALLRRRGEH